MKIKQSYILFSSVEFKEENILENIIRPEEIYLIVNLCDKEYMFIKRFKTCYRY